MAAGSSVERAGDAPAGGTGLRLLGGTGVRVSSLCLGGMGFGAWANPDHADCARIIDHALDAGINFIDTADAYSPDGESERIIGTAIEGRRDEVVLATKFATPTGPDANQRGTSRRWIMLAVEASLRRLRTDWIDLYQMHRPDPDTDLEDTLAALSDLVQQGKVRYIGSSSAAPHQIVQGQWISDRRNLRRFATEQPPYSLLVRRAEAEALPVMREYGMGVLCWSPLAGGWLSGDFHRRNGVPAEPAQANRARRMPERFDLSTPANQRKLAAVRDLARLAADGLDARQPAQAGGRAGPCAARGGCGDDPSSHGDRIRAQPSSGHLGNRRAAHGGSADRAPRRRDGDARRGGAGPDR